MVRWSTTVGASLRVRAPVLGVLVLLSFVAQGCSREEAPVVADTAPSSSPKPPSPIAPPITLSDLGVGGRFLAYRDSAAQLFVQQLGDSQAQRFAFSGLGAEAPAQIRDLALAPDDSVLAVSYQTADGKPRCALLDVRTRSVMRHFAVDYAGVALGDAGRLLLGWSPRFAEVRRVNDASLVKRLENDDLADFDAGAAAWGGTESLLHRAAAPINRVPSAPSGTLPTPPNPPVGSYLRWEPLADSRSRFDDAHCALQPALSADGRVLFSVCGGQALRLSQATNGRLKTELKLPMFAYAALSADAKRVALARSLDVEVAELESKLQLIEFRVDTPLRGVAFNADASQICVLTQKVSCRVLP